MKKKYNNGFVVTLASTAVLMLSSSAFAAHPVVNLKNAAGANITQYEAYSPKMTCGGCHTQTTAEVDADTLAIGQGPGSYDGGGATKLVPKTQGIQNEVTGDVEWVSYNVTAYEHGIVTGRHSQQGRNEAYGNHLRHAVKGKFWASSPGMFGKY